MTRTRGTRRPPTIAGTLCVAAVAFAWLHAEAWAQTAADDWPCWRGPDHDGIATESGWNANALSAGPAIKWKKEVGAGFSSVAVKGANVYTMGNRGGQDTVVCLDAATGDERWHHTYPCKEGDYAGPRATPTVDGDCVYTMSRAGQVFCLDAGSGQVRWKRELAGEMNVGIPTWGLAGSALVYKNAVFLNAGEKGVALDKTSGKTLWSNAPGKGGYATPVLFAFRGKPALALFGEKHVFGVDAATGKELWEHPWETQYDVNAADPVVSGTKVFISSGYGRGCAMLDVAGPKPRTVWEHKNMKNHFSSCVLFKGHLYGIDGNAGKGALRCLDPATGKETWSQELGFGSLIVVDGKLVVLNENGMLFIASADPASYKELSKGQVLEKKVCWTPPAFCHGKIYCRNSPGELVCVDVSK